MQSLADDCRLSRNEFCPGGVDRCSEYGPAQAWIAVPARSDCRPLQVGHPVGRGTEVGKVDPPPLLPRGQMPDSHAGLGQDRAPIRGGASLEGPIGLQALRQEGTGLRAELSARPVAWRFAGGAIQRIYSGRGTAS